MTRRVLQIAFGLAIGLLSLMLPGRHGISLLGTAALSLAGAIGGCLAAEQLFPADFVRPAGFPLAALAAIATLLLYGIAVQ